VSVAGDPVAGGPVASSRAAAAQRALIELADAAASGASVPQVLERVACAAQALVGEAVVDVWLMGEEGREFRLATELGARPGRDRVSLPPTVPAGVGLLGQVVRGPEPLVIEAPADDPGLGAPGWMRAEGLRTFVGLRLARGERVLGALCLFTPGPRRFTSIELDLLRSFAAYAALALEGAALFETAAGRLRRLETLREIERDITRQRDPEALLGTMSRRAAELLEGDTACLYLLDEAAGVLRPRAAFNRAGWMLGITVPLGAGVVGTAALRREGLVVNDYARSPLALEAFRATHRSVAAQPLVAGETLQGVIVVTRDRSERPFTPLDLVQLGDLAVQTSIAIENARLLRLAAARADRIQAAARVGQSLAATHDADQILDLIAEQCRAILGAEAVGLFRPDGDRLRYVRGIGLDPAFQATHTLAVGEGVVGRAVRDRSTVETTDILRDPRIELSPASRARIESVGSRAIVAVPLVAADRVLGALAVYHPVGVRTPPEEVEFLETLAAHAAVALENARLFAEARRRRETVEALAAITQALTASLDLRTVLSRVAIAVRELLGADGGAIGLVSADGAMRLAAWAGRGGDAFREVVVRPGEGITGWVLRHRRAFSTADYRQDPRITHAYDAEITLAGFHGGLAVPVELGDEVVGVLYAFWGRRLDPSDEQAALAAELARTAAVAVANARLYHQARKQEAEARALFEVARLIGSTLDLERVFDHIVEKGLELMHVRACGIFRVEADGVLRYVRGAGLSDEFVRTLAVRPGDGTSGRSVAERRPVWTADLLGDPTMIRDPATRVLVEREGYTAALSVPIVAQDAPFGCLATYWWEAHEPTPAEVATLTSLATLAAVAIENARLYEEARAHEREATRALEEVRRTQEQLVRMEKLRALGEMASGVAHDFNNVLAVILGRVQLLLRRVEDATLRRWLGIVEQTALEGAQTVRRIQEFTRVRRDRPTEIVDVARVVREAVEMTRARWERESQARGLEVRLRLDLAATPPVAGEPAELRESLVNLVLNAVEALPGGGDIRVSTRATESHVEISVADTGIGMSESVRRRIFEPFFTTKGPTGTGLGLAMVYGIVSRHGGEILVDSAEGRGSTFTIRLPLPREHPATPPAAAVLGPGDARVLVIDDEPVVRGTLEDMLRQQGHHVVAADDGPSGLARFQEQAFDLVMTDLAMPGMSGWQVAQAVKAARPDIPVVLVTGWGVELPPGELRVHGVDRVLAKPFEYEEVRDAVASLRRVRGPADAGRAREDRG
jgi:GAF domain-containing protein/ActR/RegA family two-component response regulator